MLDDLRTVAEMMGDEPHVDALPAELDTGEWPGPGVWFEMDDETYHAVPALSNSGIKHLQASPMDFWARSWMNPNQEPVDTEFLSLGKAYHKRILEGREAFEQCYAAGLDKADYPDALITMDHLRAALAPHGLKASDKATAIAKLREVEPDAVIWDVLVAENAAAAGERDLLSAKAIAKIEIAAAMIERHPHLCRAFTGGFPEVSIFWVDAKTGVRMKARLDYLKLKAIVDLKTLGNAQGKPFDRAVFYEVASRKYHVQAAIYSDAVAQAKVMIRACGMAAVDVQTEVVAAFVRAWLAEDAPTFMFVIQQTGVAPIARGYVLPRMNAFGIGEMTAELARAAFRDRYLAFGTDPWVDAEPIHTFDDSEFPAFLAD